MDLDHAFKCLGVEGEGVACPGEYAWRRVIRGDGLFPKHPADLLIVQQRCELFCFHFAGVAVGGGEPYDVVAQAHGDDIDGFDFEADNAIDGGVVVIALGGEAHNDGSVASEAGDGGLKVVILLGEDDAAHAVVELSEGDHNAGLSVGRAGRVVVHNAGFAGIEVRIGVRRRRQKAFTGRLDYPWIWRLLGERESIPACRPD